MQETRVDVSLIPVLGQFCAGVNGNPFQYSCWENPIEIRAWWSQSIGSQRVRHDWAHIIIDIYIVFIKPVNPKGNQPWIFIGRTDAEAEVPIIWPHDAKSQLIGKDPDAEKYWRQEEKGMTEDELVGWHHRLNGHEFEQAPGVDKGQGSLAVHVVANSWTQLSDWKMYT